MSLDPLPTGDVAAAADAVVEAGRVAETIMGAKNTADQQDRAKAAQLEAEKVAAEKAVAAKDVKATEEELAE